jgi:hypothetical protein
MICPKCNIENAAGAHFCTKCGNKFELLEPASLPLPTNIFFGILALAVPLIEILYLATIKLFCVMYRGPGGFVEHDRMEKSPLYIGTMIFIEILFWIIPILIVTKVRNLGLQIMVIVLSSIFIIISILSHTQIFNVWSWCTK